MWGLMRIQRGSRLVIDTYKIPIVSVSTWRIAASGLQQKWIGIKQRTAWRYRQLQDKNTLIVFRVEDATTQNIHLKLSTPLDDPMAVHKVMERVNKETLNSILSATSPEESNRFCYSMSGFMLHACDPGIRASLLQLLTRQRLDEITIPNRATMIRALEQCLLSPFIMQRHKTELRKAVVGILLGTHGIELSILKDSVYASHETLSFSNPLLGKVQSTILQRATAENVPKTRVRKWMNSFRNRTRKERRRIPPKFSEKSCLSDLVSLIYDILQPVEMATVLQHIAIQSTVVVEQHPQLIKVISDLDDTFLSGWLDRRYPAHTIYPGVIELFRRISRGLSHNLHDTFPSITFITARPRGWFNMGRYLTSQSLHDLGVSSSTILHGRVKGLLTNQRIAMMKYENFTRYATVFPEFKFVFFGDSGQGDAYFAQMLLDTYPHTILGAFIHDINPESFKTGDGRSKESYQQSGIVFYRSYAVAAEHAHKKQLITQNDVETVERVCVQDSNAIDLSNEPKTVK